MDSTNQPIPDGASARLVAALAEHHDVPGLTPRRYAELPACGLDLGERPITVDQTNVSVVVAEQFVVKWMRPPAAARSPELLAHLAASGFTRTPTPFGAFFEDSALVAMVTAFLPDAVDGWEWCVDDLLARRAGFAADLGTLAAELHAALAEPSAIISSPVRTAAPPLDASVLDEARRLAEDDEDGRWFVRLVPRLASEIASGFAERCEGPVIRSHGDLHVGQILRWRGGYAVIDFDGNPTGRPDWEPVARDLAQLRMSLLHVAHIVDRRTHGERHDELLSWGERAIEELLVAYRAGLAARGMSHLLDERLLRGYELEQECRELVYAARFLPRWRYAPMGVLRSWYG